LRELTGIYEALERIGRIKRTGWIMAKIPNDIAESIAEHTMKTVFTAMEICREMGLRRSEEKIIKMALIHDLAEAFTSDVPKPVKERVDRGKLDELSMEYIKTIIKDEELINLYEEYIKGGSVEAKIVDLADTIATYIQSVNYRAQYGIRTEHLEAIIEHTGRSSIEKAEKLGLKVDSIVKKLIGI
jgi:putative hydrolase of HD superfamily